jgi:D-sedoheptulose 7-phosphate isomerase
MGVVDYLKTSESALAAMRGHGSVARIDPAVDLIVAALSSGKPLLVCGNGGSAADAMHIAAELVGRFHKERRAYNCIALSSNPALLSAWSNDYSYDTVFSRQVQAYGSAGGALLGLSTSGNSKNVVEAFKTARTIGLRTIALTGEGGGQLAALSDLLIDVPSRSTPVIQQVHICLYHYMCEKIEVRLSQQP